MKKALVALVVLVLLVAGAVLWAYYSLDVIVKLTLEHYGPDVAGVSVRVGHVAISPRDGRGSLRNVEIGSDLGLRLSRGAGPEFGLG